MLPFSFIFASLILAGSFTDTTVVATRVENTEIANLLNNIELLKEIRTDEIFVRVWAMGDSPGSAGPPSGEVATSIFIAVYEYGEYPEHNVFRLTSVDGPEIESVNDKRNSITIMFRYVDTKSLEMVRFTAVVFLKSVQIES